MWTCEGGGGAGLASFKRAGLKLSVTPSVARNTMSSVVCVCVCVCVVWCVCGMSNGWLCMEND